MFWQNKHREASEQAFFLFIIWRCLAEALGTYGLDMIPGTSEVPWGHGGNGCLAAFFGFLLFTAWPWSGSRSTHFFFLVKTTWHQPALEDGPGFLGGGVQTKGTTRRLGHGGNGG